MSTVAHSHEEGKGAPGDDPSGWRAWPEMAAYWSVYGTRLAVVVLGLAVGIVSARGLGPSGRGTYAATITSTALLVQLANLGASSAVLYFVSRRPRRAATFLAAAWGAGLLLLALGLPASLLLRWAGATSPALVLIALWAPVQMAATLQDQIFLGVKRFRDYGALQLGGRCLSLLTAGAAVHAFPGDPHAFVVSQLAAEAATLVAGTWRLLTSGQTGPIRPVPIGPVARLAVRAWPVLIVPFLLVRCDILLVRLVRGSLETGLYSVAAQVVDVLLLLPATFGSVLFVSLAQARDRAAITLRAGRWVLGLLSVLAVFLALAGSWAVPLLFGRPFAPSYGPLVVLLPGAVLLGFQTIVSQYFGAKAYPWFIARYWLVGLAVNLAANAFALPRFGAVGAAAASTLAYATVTWLVWRRFARETGITIRALWRA